MAPPSKWPLCRALRACATETSDPALLAVLVVRSQGEAEIRPDSRDKYLAAWSDANRNDRLRLARESIRELQLAELRPVESIVRAGARPKIVGRSRREGTRMPVVRPDMGFQAAGSRRRLRYNGRGCERDACSRRGCQEPPHAARAAQPSFPTHEAAQGPSQDSLSLPAQYPGRRLSCATARTRTAVGSSMNAIE